MAAGAERRDADELASPPDRPVGQGLEQDAAQVAARHLGPAAGAVVGLLEQHRAVRSSTRVASPPSMDDRAERVGQAGGRERRLAVLLVDVEHAALRAASARGLGLVDRRRDAVEMQDAGEHEAAEAGADDR